MTCTCVTSSHLWSAHALSRLCDTVALVEREGGWKHFCQSVLCLRRTYMSMCQNRPPPLLLFHTHTHTHMHITPLKGLLGSRVSLGRAEGFVCVCFFSVCVCVVRMWLAPLTSHDLLTGPAAVRARHSAHTASVSCSVVRQCGNFPLLSFHWCVFKTHLTTRPINTLASDLSVLSSLYTGFLLIYAKGRHWQLCSAVHRGLVVPDCELCVLGKRFQSPSHYSAIAAWEALWESW